MSRKSKKTRKGWGAPINVELPTKEDATLRGFAESNGMTPTTAVRMLTLRALAAEVPSTQAPAEGVA